jgi:hypothetical protein
MLFDYILCRGEGHGNDQKAAVLHDRGSTYCLPPTCLLPASCSLLPAPCFLLPAPCSLLPTSYCLLPTAYCLLPTMLMRMTVSLYPDQDARQRDA